MSMRRGGDEDAAGLLQAKVEQLEVALAAMQAERDRLERQLMAQEDLTQMLEGLPAADGTGPMPAVRARGPRTGGHRAPKDRHLHLVKWIPGFAPLAAFLRDTWHAHHATVVAAGAATVAAPVALAAALTVAVPAPAAHPGQRAAIPAPAASAYRATPITSPSARPKADAAKASPAATVTDGPPSYPPSTAPSPAPPVPPSPAALLSLSTGELDTGVFLVGHLTISSSGSAVPWSVACSQDVSITPSQGVLSAGQQDYPLTVRIDPVDGASSGSCTFSPGDEHLLVTWDGAGSPSAGI